MVPNIDVRTFGKGSVSQQIDSILLLLQNQGFKGKPYDIIMLGDRFDTDMEFGLINKTRTLLVETGCDHIRTNHRLQYQIEMVASSIKDIPHTQYLPQTNLQKVNIFLNKCIKSRLTFLIDYPMAKLSFEKVVHHAERSIINTT